MNSDMTSDITWFQPCRTLLCKYLWSLRWSWRRKALPQMSHEYGRSSVCVRSWISKLYDLVNCRLQNLHMNCFLGRDADVDTLAPDLDTVAVDVTGVATVVDAVCCCNSMVLAAAAWWWYMAFMSSEG